MKRRLFNLAAAASTMLLLALAGLCARSYFRQDIFFVETREIGLPLDSRDRASKTWADSHSVGWRSKGDRYYRTTRYELHISRGRVAMGRSDDSFLPRQPKPMKRIGRARLATSRRPPCRCRCLL